MEGKQAARPEKLYLMKEKQEGAKEKKSGRGCMGK